MPTYRNDRTNATVTTDLAPTQLAARFAELYGGRDHWLWFHLARSVADRAPQPATAAALRYLQDSFLLAIAYSTTKRAEADAKAKAAGRKVKDKTEMPRSPMIRVHFGDSRIKLYLSKRGTVCLKAGRLAAPAADGSRDPVGDEEYVGCLLGGRFLQARQQAPNAGRYNWRRGRSYDADGAAANDRNRPLRPLHPDEAAFLAGLEADPVGFLARCSRDMGRCCYCYRPLEDPRSKEVGYGPDCAARWGLPWGAKGRAEKVPAFSEVYNDDAAGLLWDIRANPADPARWAVFADWLEEHGLPRCSPPPAGAVLPRNDDAPRPVPAGPAAPADEDDGPPPLPPRDKADDTVPDDRLPWGRSNGNGAIGLCLADPALTHAGQAQPQPPAGMSAATKPDRPDAKAPPILTTTQFSYTGPTKTFSAEASNLGWRPGQFPRAFDLLNPRTGNTVRMTRDHDEIEGGELVAVLYRTDSGLWARVTND